MPKNKFQELIFTIQETRRQLAINQISPEVADVVFSRLLLDYEKIKKSSDNDDFQVFFKKLL